MFCFCLHSRLHCHGYAGLHLLVTGGGPYLHHLRQVSFSTSCKYALLTTLYCDHWQ